MKSVEKRSRSPHPSRRGADGADARQSVANKKVLKSYNNHSACAEAWFNRFSVAVPSNDASLIKFCSDAGYAFRKGRPSVAGFNQHGPLAVVRKIALALAVKTLLQRGHTSIDFVFGSWRDVAIIEDYNRFCANSPLEPITFQVINMHYVPSDETRPEVVGPASSSAVYTNVYSVGANGSAPSAFLDKYLDVCWIGHSFNGMYGAVLSSCWMIKDDLVHWIPDGNEHVYLPHDPVQWNLGEGSDETCTWSRVRSFAPTNASHVFLITRKTVPFSGTLSPPPNTYKVTLEVTDMSKPANQVLYPILAKVPLGLTKRFLSRVNVTVDSRIADQLVSWMLGRDHSSYVWKQLCVKTHEMFKCDPVLMKLSTVFPLELNTLQIHCAMFAFSRSSSIEQTVVQSLATQRLEYQTTRDSLSAFNSANPQWSFRRTIVVTSVLAIGLAVCYNKMMYKLIGISLGLMKIVRPSTQGNIFNNPLSPLLEETLKLKHPFLTKPIMVLDGVLASYRDMSIASGVAAVATHVVTSSLPESVVLRTCVHYALNYLPKCLVVQPIAGNSNFLEQFYSTPPSLQVSLPDFPITTTMSRRHFPATECGGFTPKPQRNDVEVLLYDCVDHKPSNYGILYSTCLVPCQVPARTVDNARSLLSSRVLVKPPISSQEQYEAMSGAFDVWPPMSDDFEFTFDDWLEHMTAPQRARMLRARELNEQSPIKPSSYCAQNIKVNMKEEALLQFDENHVPRLKARPIYAVDERVIARTGPEIYKAYKRLALAWNGHNVQNICGYRFCYYYASTPTPINLSQWFNKAIAWVQQDPSANVAMALLGDDSLVMYCRKDGTIVVDEGDFSAYDTTEQAGALSNEARFLAHAGVSEETIEFMRRSWHASISLKAGRQTVARVNFRSPRRPTGANDTSGGNTCETARTWTNVLIRTELQPTEAAFLGFGYVVKLKQYTLESWSTPVFLKGAFFCTPDSAWQWCPLLIRLFKYTKTITDPSVHRRKGEPVQSPEEYERRHFCGVALGIASCNAGAPLRTWISYWLSRAFKSDRDFIPPEVAYGVNLSDNAHLTDRDRAAIDRLEMMRYNVSEEEYYDLARALRSPEHKLLYRPWFKNVLTADA